MSWWVVAPAAAPAASEKSPASDVVFRATAVLHPEDFRIRTVADLLSANRDERASQPCRSCDGTRWWRLKPAGDWICAACHPPQPARERIEVREVATDGARGEVRRV